MLLFPDKLPLLAMLASLLVSSAPPQAEEIELRDGTKIKGEIVSYSPERVIVRTDKANISFPKAEIARIEVAPPRSDPRFSSPERTIQHWLRAARTSDIEQMVRCYLAFGQGAKRKELQQISRDDLRTMHDDANKTSFDIAEPLIIGTHATVKVAKGKGEKAPIELFELELEHGEWKIIP